MWAKSDLIFIFDNFYLLQSYNEEFLFLVLLLVLFKSIKADVSQNKF